MVALRVALSALPLALYSEMARLTTRGLVLSRPVGHEAGEDVPPMFPARSVAMSAGDADSEDDLVEGDAVHYARVFGLRNQLPVMPKWRWRVLHSLEDTSGFMITGRGWAYAGQEDWPTRGLLLPMGPRLR